MSKQLSYVAGGAGIPPVYTDMPSLLDLRAVELPDKEAYVFRFRDETRKFTRIAKSFKEIADNSLEFAAALLELGIKPGDRIAIAGRNCPEYLYVDYGCLRIKVVMIRLPSCFLNEEKLINVLQKYSCVALVVDEPHALRLNSFIKDFVEGSLPDVVAEKLKIFKNIICLDKVPSSDNFPRGIRTVDEMKNSGGQKSTVLQIQETIDPEETVMVLPTSGSTGESKFVGYSHFSYINGLMRTVRISLEERAKETVLNFRSFTWVGGYAHMPVILGGTLVSIDEAVGLAGQSLEEIYELFEEEKISNASMPPYFLYDAMVGMERNIFPPKVLKLVGVFGEKLSPAVTAFVKKVFDQTVNAYGATETLGVCLGAISADNKFDTGSISAMRCVPYAEIKIIGDDGKVLPRGEVGLVRIRTPFSMTGYFLDPAATSLKKSEAGWIDVGDVGMINPDGNVLIIGRTSDVISLGTRKLHPKIPEDILKKHPKVRHVVVVGVPDPRLHQVICACVVPEPNTSITEDELRQFFKSTILSEGICPRFYIIQEDFPKTYTGKFDRPAITDFAIKRLGLEK